MKFGQQLKTALHTEWRFYYIDYDALKQTLRTRLEDNPLANAYSQADSHSFIQLLSQELDKVAGFQQIKKGEIDRRVHFCEERVREIAERDVENEEELEVEFADLEAEINRVIAEVNELQRFARLNYTGFLKIMKKHDKHTEYHVRPAFLVKLEERPFYKENFDQMILKLSKLYDSVRRRGKITLGAGKNDSGAAQNFVRRTTKYWVHPDNVFELKCFILKYLPVLVFNAQKDDQPDREVDPAITSIYFDNPQLDLYKGRLEKDELAEAIRFRWYGGWDNTEIFIERKTHHEDWTGESSVKQRFAVKEKYVNKFMRGEWTVEKMVKKLREEGKKGEEEIAALEKLAQEIQQSLLNKRLQPALRTFYNRTAFQLPGDARVRISLDTQLTMIREDDFDGLPRAGSNWRRVDARTDYPFAHIKPSDICRFPYAVLEVKLQTQAGTSEPAWVKELINSHLVEEVPKFSKFVHGCAVLMEDRVPLLPFWLPQMDKDIRRAPQEASRDSLLTRDLPVSSFSYRPNSRPNSRNHRRDEIPLESKRGKSRLVDDDEAPNAEGENTPLLEGTSRRARRASDASSTRSTSRRRFLFGSIGNMFRRKSPSPRRRSPNRGAPNKKVAVPVRVEPKVFFANERTFLSWLHFAIVLGGLALGLFNFGDNTGIAAGVLFTIIAMGIMLYALWLFRWRAVRIRRKDPGPYDDQKGPVVLVVVIIAAIAINFWLKFSSLGKE